MPARTKGGSRAARTSGRTRPRGRASFVRTLKKVAIGTASLAFAGALSLSVLFWYYGRGLPTVDALRSYQPPQTTRVLDRKGRVLGEIFEERRTVVSMERIPRVVVLSVLAAEDADFYQHKGLDYPGLVRALFRAVVRGDQPRGTSTITQQVVKLLLLTPERKVSRKVRELILARRLEQELTKDEILHLYLNHINFGHGRYGVQEASRFYFDKDVADLTLAEASMIAGVPQSPSRLSPRTHLERAKARQTYVLDQLERKRAEYWRDLSPDEIERARSTDVVLASYDAVRDDAPDLVSLVRKELSRHISAEDIARGGYVVETTFDAELQREARKALQKGLRDLDERHGWLGPIARPSRERRKPKREIVEELQSGKTYSATVTGSDDAEKLLLLDVGGRPVRARLDHHARYNPRGLAPSAFAERGARVPVSLLHDASEGTAAEVRLELGPEGAIVMIDPRTRDVVALVGSYDADAGFNRAWQAVRQPGSTFKPIVYALGIRSKRFTPATLVVDAPAVYEEWKPSNFETWQYEGAVRLREALARSINLVAVRVIEDVSPQETVSFAKQLGIRTELEASLALALGASDVKPLELTNAYATFAAGGTFKPARIIRRIVGPDQKEIALAEAEPAREVLTPAEAYLVTSMLRDVVERGTGSAAKALGRPAAGKTGTSNEARDAWFMGYTPNVVAGVWIGFDDRRSLGRRESGGRSAVPIWVAAMKAAEAARPKTDFPRPSGIVTALIDPASGLLAYEGMETAIEEVFLEGTAPTLAARPPDVADPATFLMEQFGGAVPSPSDAGAKGADDGTSKAAPTQAGGGPSGGSSPSTSEGAAP